MEAGQTPQASVGPQYTGNSPRRFSSTGRSSDYASDSSQKSDRMARFSQWNQGNYRSNRGRMNSPHRNRNFNSGQRGQPQSQTKSAVTLGNNGGTSNNSYNNVNFNPGNAAATTSQQANMYDESCVSQTEDELEAGDHDDTVFRFAAHMEDMKEEHFKQFCAMEDEAKASFFPGNC